jgi:phage baseplate assembly protein W
MAVVLGQKKVLDTKEFEDYAIGITLPLQIGDSAFNQSFKTADQVKTNIKSLLLTKRYERVMQPLLGSGLQELLFEFNDEELADKIENTINDSLQQWLPYVSVEKIEIEQSNDNIDRNIVYVSISFRIGDTINLENLSFTVTQ